MPFLQELKRRVVTDPTDTEARFQLGEALYGEGDLAGAVRQLEKALALSPQHANARHLLARAYARDNRLAVAERTLRAGIERAPTDASLRDLLAELLEHIGRLDDALLQLEEAAEIDADSLERRLHLVTLYERRGLTEPARRHLARAAERYPDDPRVTRLLREGAMDPEEDVDPLSRGREYLLGRTLEALTGSTLRDAVAIAGLTEVTAALRAGDLQAAKRAQLSAPPGPLADFVRAELALAEGDPVRAEKALERAVGTPPEFALIWERLAERRRARGAMPECLEAANRALALDAERALAHLLRGEALAARGQEDDAERAFLRAAQLDPGGPVVRHRPPVEGDGDAIGRIGVLGWNPTGGSVSILEATTLPGTAQLIVTGNVGELGREAARVAFSYLQSSAESLGLPPRMQRQDLHLHYSDMAFAKDGPSAGLALFLAAYSACAQRRLRAHLAASGEITLHGAVRPVGGIAEKLAAAALAGIHRVLLPRRNLLDVRSLSPEVVRRLDIVHVDSATEALAEATAEHA